jgi:hypothetical protein
MAIYSGFSHWKWWFSIVMLNYQRVNPPHQIKSTHFAIKHWRRVEEKKASTGLESMTRWPWDDAGWSALYLVFKKKPTGNVKYLWNEKTVKFFQRLKLLLKEANHSGISVHNILLNTAWESGLRPHSQRQLSSVKNLERKKPIMVGSQNEFW